MLIQWLRSEMLRPSYEADPGAPSGGAGEPPVVPPPTPAGEPPADDFDKDRAMATISKLREFEKAAKAQLKELETLKAEKQQRDDAELTAAQKAEKRASELQAQLDAAAARLKRHTLEKAVASAATKKGLTFAQGALEDAIALGLFDSLTWEDDTPKGVAAALGDLATARPYLFAAPAQAPDIGALEKGKPRNGIDRTDLAKRWGLKVG